MNCPSEFLAWFVSRTLDIIRIQGMSCYGTSASSCGLYMISAKVPILLALRCICIILKIFFMCTNFNCWFCYVDDTFVFIHKIFIFLLLLLILLIRAFNAEVECNCKLRFIDVLLSIAGSVCLAYVFWKNFSVSVSLRGTSGYSWQQKFRVFIYTIDASSSNFIAFSNFIFTTHLSGKIFISWNI